jgi:glycerophosphoryl diester phosphodiesterase
VIVTGHRGAMGSEPENTLRSFRRAVREGCDEIELDLRVTVDGRLVVLHDATVDRTTDGSGAVADLTFDEVRALDAGLGEQVPTWAEAVAAVDVRFQAEVKAEAAIPLLVESLRADPDLASRTAAAAAGTALCGIAGLTVDGVVELHERGFDVTAWPVPDAQVLATAVELAVDGLTTDHPDRLRRVAVGHRFGQLAGTIATS